MDVTSEKSPVSWAEFGRRLRFWRRRSGLTQVQLGLRLGYHHSHISKLEKGFRGPSADLPFRVDELFGTGGELAAIWARAIGDRGSGLDGPSGVTVVGGPLMVPMPDTGRGGEGAGAPILVGWPARLPANGLPCPMHGTAGCAVPPAEQMLTTDLDPARRGRSGHRTAQPDADTVHGLTALLASYTRMNVEQTLVDIVVPVERTLHAIVRWADDVRPSPCHVLLRLAAHYAQLAGWLRVLRGQNGLGMAWYHHGITWAEVSGDITARVALLCDMSVLARIERDAQTMRVYTRALGAADPTRRWVLTMARLYEARSHALSGDLHEFERHITLAGEHLVRLDARDRAEAPWLTGGEGLLRVEACAAGALRDIAVLTGDRAVARRAVTAARSSLACLPSRMHPTRVLLTLRLADTYACAGQVDEAVATARSVLTEAMPALRITITKELHGLQARLTGLWDATPEVRDLGELIRDKSG